jgi:hypothetical protein
MKKLLMVLTMFLSVSLFSYQGNSYDTNYSGVKLGVAAGWSYSDINEDDVIKDHNNLIWGFYVDIPLISTFNIVPSAMLYKVNYLGADLVATDISLSAKFKVPLSLLTLYVLGTGGLTQIQLAPQDGISANVGFGFGASLNLVSNISFFGEGNYRIILADDGNIKNYYLSVGLLWGF